MEPITDATSRCEWTGERFIPAVRGDIALEHLHRYALARGLGIGKDVLDIACGEGYGSRLLVDVASSVVGVDISEDVIRHARIKYRHDHLEFRQGDCAAIPVADGGVDLVVSFETIEHHDRHEAMLSEIKRVLRPGGQLLMSSPDKLRYSDLPESLNEFHVKELYFEEFRELLTRHFAHNAFFGQKVCYGSLIAPLEDGPAAAVRSFSGNAEGITEHSGIKEPLYILAVSSDDRLPTLPSGLFDGTDTHVAEVMRMRQDLADAHQRLEEMQNSVSWRVTGPLRRFRRGVRRVLKI